ncbi:SusF/SusE family outer membrane protein [Treponema sp.]|uniref:SusF/SusE family outer membrane protein n=1 Tax=Treponema sp. TaxID=166 RepID=UPI00257DE0E8|nr:SusF/SusE family outer membrane protein [Treponema sp.]
MKKILSVFAAAAVLFGFASCSGDLHDDIAPEQMYLIGALSSSTWDKTEPMTTVSTGVYTITTEFLANSEFKLIKVADKGGDSWPAAQDQWGSDGFSSKGAAANFKLGNSAAGKYKITVNIMTNSLEVENANTVISGTVVPVGTAPVIRGNIVDKDWNCTSMNAEGDGTYTYITKDSDNKGDQIVILLMTEAEAQANSWANSRRYGNPGGIKIGEKTALDAIGEKVNGKDNNTTIQDFDNSKNYKITVSSDTEHLYCLIEETTETPAVKLQEAAQLKGSIGDVTLTWENGVAVVEKTLAADYKDSWNKDNPNTISFGLLTVADNWNKPCYKSTTMLVGDETPLKIDTATNNKVVSIEPLAGKKVKFTFTGTETTIKCKAEIVE